MKMTKSQQQEAFERFISKVIKARTPDQVREDDEKRNHLTNMMNAHRSAKDDKRSYSYSYRYTEESLIEKWPCPLFPSDGRKAVSIGTSEFSWPAKKPCPVLNTERWTELVFYSLIGVAYSRTPVDLFKNYEAHDSEAEDDLYLFHLISFNEGLKTHAFKLGRSGNVNQRMTTFRSSSGCCVIPVLILKGAGKIEPLVHKCLADRGIKGPLSEFYFSQNLPHVLLAIAVMFQQTFKLDFCLEIQRSIDVCAARFARKKDDSSYFYNIDCRVGCELETLANTVHPSFSGVAYGTLVECAPSQDTESLEIAAHNGDGMLRLLFGDRFSHAVRHRRSVGEEWPVLDMCYSRGDIVFLSQLPFLSLNLLNRFLASLRVEFKPLIKKGCKHTDVYVFSDLADAFTMPSFPREALNLIPEAFRCAEMGVDLITIANSFGHHDKD